MRKPIIQSISNNMGTILVIRSPRSRTWLFNLSISITLENTLTNLKGYAMKTLLTSVILFAAFILSACGENPMTANNEATPKYKYMYHADTIWADNAMEGIASDNKRVDIKPDSVWNTATVYLTNYKDEKWKLASLTYAKPGNLTNPTYWDGSLISVDLNKIPTDWNLIIVRYSKKVQVN